MRKYKKIKSNLETTNSKVRVFRRQMSMVAVGVSLLVVVGSLSMIETGRQDNKTTASSGMNLRVSGNKIVNENGQTIKLVGVNKSGTEYACAQGWGMFDGPVTDESIKAIASWKANTVRVPLNETCWLGINGVNPDFSGANYQNAIQNYVNTLTSNGFAVILDLHWSAPGSTIATRQLPMPNRDHSPEFWRQVATKYKGYGNVIFDLYNEPYPDNNTADSSEGWRCWRDGGTCVGVEYQAAGMQELVNAVRSTGAPNIVMLSGLQYSNSLVRWLNYKPNDSLNNMAAAVHVYNFNRCITQACFDAEYGPVVAQYPLIVGEMGPDEARNQSCTLVESGFSNGLMDWLDAKGAHYTAWTWNTWSGYCRALITNYNGTATTVWGQNYKSRLAKLASSPGSTTKVGDINGDTKIDIFDLSILLSDWSKTGAGLRSDLNGDAVVNIFDLSKLLSVWNS